VTLRNLPATYGEETLRDFSAMPPDIQTTYTGIIWVLDQYYGFKYFT
jgi:hypothetical protein